MPDAIKVCAVLLAAGASTRFGAADKLIADIAGRPLVARCADRIIAAEVADVIAVTAPGEPGQVVAAALQGLPVRIVVNAETDRGMGTSIARGTTAVVDANAGIMIVPGDMPSLDVALLNALIAAFRTHDGNKIVHPVTQSGEQRNPVIWPAWLRAELAALESTQGGKSLLAAHHADVVTISTSSDQAFDDVDTTADLDRFRR